MSKNSTNKTHDKNTRYIAIITILIAVVLITGVIVSQTKDTSAPSGSAESAVTTIQKIVVQSEQGNQNETINTNIKFRKIKFSKSINDIKKFESKQDDTVDEPNTATSSDGYTYLSYDFNQDNLPSFWGTTVAASSSDATAPPMLTYVFTNDNLYEVRVQFGSLGENAFNSVCSSIAGTYGDSTYSRTYSNGSKDSWWKTSKVSLTVSYHSSDSSIIAYYRNLQ